MLSTPIKQRFTSATASAMPSYQSLFRLVFSFPSFICSSVRALSDSARKAHLRAWIESGLTFGPRGGFAQPQAEIASSHRRGDGIGIRLFLDAIILWLWLWFYSVIIDHATRKRRCPSTRRRPPVASRPRAWHLRTACVCSSNHNTTIVPVCLARYLAVLMDVADGPRHMERRNR